MIKLMLLATLLAATANADTGQLAQQVHHYVNTHMTYRNYASASAKPMQDGDSGNCTAFAETYKQRLQEAGTDSFVWKCMYYGTPHAVTVTRDGWVLDNLKSYVYRIKGERVYYEDCTDLSHGTVGADIKTYRN